MTGTKPSTGLTETKVHSRAIVRFAAERPEVVVLSGDLTGSTEIADFRAAYPDRFFSLGMAEQNMLSWAGGLAREGFRPFVHTFSVFLVRRPYDQLAMSVAYPHLPVRLIGFLPGITTPGGVTHQAIEDVSLMRGLPNMTVFETGDVTDVESVIDLTDQIDGPVYIRNLRGELPRLFDEPLRFNRARRLREDGPETDICVVSSGICTEEAMRAVDVLARRGVKLEHLHVTTLKPFTDSTVVAAIGRSRSGVITMENHSINGGLGTAVAEVMAEQGLALPLRKIGLADTFAHGASRDYLMAKYGLDSAALVARVEELLGERFNISADELLSSADADGSLRGADVADSQMEAL